MKSATATAAALLLCFTGVFSAPNAANKPPSPTKTPSPKSTKYPSSVTIEGFDVSGNKDTVDFNTASQDNIRFVLIKATEGKGTKDPSFSKHYTNAGNAGIIRAAYHVARPADSPGDTQAQFFYTNVMEAKNSGSSGGASSMPGVVQLLGDCGKLNAQQMVDWITSFTSMYQAMSQRAPMICTSATWWSQCTANTQQFGSTNLLVLSTADNNYYYNDPGYGGNLPGGWKVETIRQYTKGNKYGENSDRINGGMEVLVRLTSSDATYQCNVVKDNDNKDKDNDKNKNKTGRS